MARRGQAKGRPSVWRTKTKTKKQQRSGALKRADPAGALIPGRIWETAQKGGGEGLQNAEKRPPSGSTASPPPHGCSRGWELWHSAVASKLRWFFFQRDFVFNRDSAFNTNFACECSWFTNSAFFVSGGRAALAVILLAWLLCSQLHPGLSHGNNNPSQPSSWVIVVPWWLQSRGDCSTANSLEL